VRTIGRVLQDMAARVALAGTRLRDCLRQPTVRGRLLIVLAAAFVCVYAVSVLWYALGLPEIGLRCAFSLDVERASPGYFTLPEGLSYHDLEGKRIVRLGTQEVRSWPEFLRALRGLPDDRPVEVGLDNPDHTPAPTLLCQPRRLPWMLLAPSILWFFLKMGLFAVGALVFWNRPEDRSANRFFWLCVVTFGAYLGGLHWSRILTQPALLLVFMVCAVLLPAVSLHFYLVFPRPKPFLERWPAQVLLAIYGLPVGFLLILLWGYLHVRWLSHANLLPGNVAALDVLLREILQEIYAYFAVAAVWYLLSVVSLGHSYVTARDATERNQVKWILAAAVVATVPIGYTLYLAFWERAEFGAGGGTWWMVLASVFFTVAFTVSITRYKLMQLDQLIGSGVIYFLLSLLAGLVYYGVIFVGTWLFSRWMGNLTAAIAAALVLLLVLDFLRGRVMRALDRRFYRQKYQLDRTLKRLSQAIEKLVDPPALARRMLQEAAELLGVRRGAVYLREGNPPLYRLADHLGLAPALTELSPGCPLIEALPGCATVLVRPRSAPEDAAQRQLRFLGGEVAHALVHEGQMLALLVLGPREAGPYSPEDLNLVESFAQITVLALVSAEGHRTIEALNRDLQAKVEKIAEQQRRILALQSQLVRKDEGIRAKEEPRTNGDDDSSSVPPSVSPPSPAGIIGSSPQLRDVLHLVRKVSDSQANVLILGESGTGKELLARALHEHSPRAGKAFVPVHCGSFSPTLLESELFGHVKGAFTGAHRDRVGRFEQADGGTLFLDEIGDIAPEVQIKLLRVLQERTFERVGSGEPIRVDVRVLAATHCDLEQLIREGRFRQDLYYRLNVISIAVPPLRERREDIPELALHFLRLYAQRCGRPVAQVDDDALAALKAFAWPGNVRQLENVIQRAVVVAEGPALTLRELPPELVDGVESILLPVRDEDDDTPLELSLGVHAERAARDRREREQLVRALAATNGNKAEAARVLGMARSTLVSRLKKHGLS
jgi:transcriptional regulator with GAF, ATPase, and Fis domain